MSDEQDAKDILIHYITMVMESCGLKVDSDTYAELSMAVDSIISAAVARAREEGSAHNG
jgi:hypothetical protein